MQPWPGARCGALAPRPALALAISSLICVGISSSAAPRTPCTTTHDAPCLPMMARRGRPCASARALDAGELSPWRMMSLRGGNGEESELEALAEELRRRIPDDEEVREVEDSARVGVRWDPRAAEALRSELGNFQIDVEGAEEHQVGGDDDIDDEDMYGPAGLLRDFWELETHSKMGSSLLKPPQGVPPAGASRFAAAVREANGQLFDLAEELNVACGADRILGLPYVRGPSDASAVSAAVGAALDSDKHRGRLANLLGLCVDGGLPDGMVGVAASLMVCLPVSTTARILAALRHPDGCFASYWGESGDAAKDADEAAAQEAAAALGVEGGTVGVGAWMCGEAVFGKMGMVDGVKALIRCAVHGPDELMLMGLCSAEGGLDGAAAALGGRRWEDGREIVARLRLLSHGCVREGVFSGAMWEEARRRV